jgi:hypothetical protein
MKKALFAGVLMVATAAFAQTQTTQPAGGQTGTQQGGQPQTQTKTIANAEEYNAYMSATQQQDPAARGAALEAFVQQYPNSVVKEDALVAAMAAYQQAGNAQKSVAMAGAILQSDPNNVPALAVQTFVKRSECAGMQQPPQQAECFAQVGQMAQSGLQQLANYSPNGVSPADLEKQRKAFSQIFNGAAGQAALAQKDYPNAQKFLSAAVQGQPDNIQDVYPLALSFTQQTPQTDQSLLNGVWYMARVVNLLQAQPGLQAQADQISKAGLYYLKKFHGNQPDAEQLWQQVIAMAKTSPAPPQNYFTMIPKAPSPAEQVRAKLQANPDITKLTFGEWQEIFTFGDEQAKQMAFAQIQGKPFKFGGAKVLGADESSVDLALSYDDIQSNTIDAHVVMVEPFKKVPEVGSEFSFQANPVSFQPNPFIMQFDQGVDLTKRAASRAAPKGKTAPKSKSKAKSKR